MVATSEMLALFSPDWIGVVGTAAARPSKMVKLRTFILLGTYSEKRKSVLHGLKKLIGTKCIETRKTDRWGIRRVQLVFTRNSVSQLPGRNDECTNPLQFLPAENITLIFGLISTPPLSDILASILI